MNQTIATLLPIIDGEDKSSPLKNCIRNTYQHLRKWAKRTSTDCFRIYDRHLHHYPFAIDYYAGRFCIHYYSPNRFEPEVPEELGQEVETILKDLFNAPRESIFWRTRKKRGKFEQYEKKNDEQEFFTVHEFGVKFLVNLKDYLDTGLFLDHRETRALVSTVVKGKRLLNLFAYTGSFSVHAALNGATETETVDMSNTYTDWGRKNFALNGLDPSSHTVIRADCFKYLQQAIFLGKRFDVIVIDPPTISRSKKMEALFDVQQDYKTLIESSLQLLEPGGIIFFSTNSRSFQFDKDLFPGCKIDEVTKRTLPVDFIDPYIHKVWKIT